MALLGRQRFVVNDLEVDKSDAMGLFVIDAIGHAGVAVRPEAVEFVAPHSMGASQLSPRRLHDFATHLPLGEVDPQAFARNLRDSDGVISDRLGTESIVIEHAEALDFPSLPILFSAPEVNRNPGHPKIKVRQFRDRPPAAIAAFDEPVAIITMLLREGVDLDGIQHCRHFVDQRPDARNMCK